MSDLSPGPQRPGLRRVLVAACLLLAALGACSSDEPTTTLTAEVQRSRLFELQRQLKLVVSNEGDTTVELTRLQLDSVLFEPAPAQDRPSTLEPGERVSIPISFGPSVCDAHGSAADDPPEVLLALDGEERRLPLSQHPEDALASLNARECGTEAVLDAASLEWSEELEPAGDFTLRTTLDLEQLVDGTTVTVDEIRSSVVFTVAPEGDEVPLLEVDDAHPSDHVAATFTAARCDAHALTESKKTFRFTAFVHLDDGEAVRVEVEATGALREQLEAFLADCLANPGALPG
jgi:hypothetical protein